MISVNKKTKAHMLHVGDIIKWQCNNEELLTFVIESICGKTINNDIFCNMKIHEFDCHTKKIKQEKQDITIEIHEDVFVEYTLFHEKTELIYLDRIYFNEGQILKIDKICNVNFEKISPELVEQRRFAMMGEIPFSTQSRFSLNLKPFEK